MRKYILLRQAALLHPDPHNEHACREAFEGLSREERAAFDTAFGYGHDPLRRLPGDGLTDF